MTPDSSDWHPIALPELGANDQPIRVSTWLTQIGEEVVAGEAIVEVLLKGITFDVAAPVSGQLRRRRTKTDWAKKRSRNPLAPTEKRTVRSQIRPHLRNSDQLAPADKLEIPIADRPWPAGSGIEDFPTPTGVRNSKRKRNVCF